MNIYENQKVEQQIRVGRQCDNCGFQELSDRISIRNDHSTDARWAKVQLHTTYTLPENNREYHLCSKKCIQEWVVQLANVYVPISETSDLSGIPLRYFREIVTNE